MSCLDENTLAALMERTLPRAEQERATAHLDRCATCRKLVSAMASWYPREDGRPREGTVTVHLTPGRDMRAVREAEDPATTLSAPVPGDLSPGARVDRYVLLRPIASGGMSVVFAAYDPELDRRLAIKFLRSGSREPLDDARLLREAQVMARLSHPNVVQLHDVGLYGDRVFLAMELVEGSTLRHWMVARKRSRAEVMEVLLGAGRGLAAAHRAGVVHRDFKPENVLVGDDGRARVMDFGLARASPGGAVLDASRDQPAGGAADPLTRPGVVLGTPGYMAPEQLSGSRGDARTDQFAFCCALYEALAGSRPFTGTGLKEYTASVVSRRPIKPLSPFLPARVRGAVARGLSLEPERRFGSMDELLDALRLPFWRRPGKRRRLAAGAAAVGASALLAVALWVGTGGPRCQDPEDELAGAWDAQRRAAVAAALDKVPGADARGALDALDRQAERWARTSEALCQDRATRSPADDAGARACLQRRRADLLAASELLTGPAARPAWSAMTIASSALSPDECRNAHPPPVPPAPEDASESATADRLRRLERLRGQVSRARALLVSGRPRDAAVALGNAAGEAPAAGDPALEPEALHVRARILIAQVSFAAAERSLHESIWAAERSRHDEQAARSWIALYRLVGADLQDEARARELRPHVEAAVARAGSPPLLAAELGQATGVVLASASEPAAALPLLASSLDTLQRSLGVEDPYTIEPLERYGEVQGLLGQLVQAEHTLQGAVALAERTLTAAHPRTASAQVRLGAVRSRLGLHAEAVQVLQGALAVASAGGGEDPSLLFRVSHALGEALHRAGRLMPALARQKEALSVAEAVFGPGSPRAAAAQAALGDVHCALGEYGQALELHRRAAALDPLSARALDGAGTDLRLLGRPAEALEMQKRALALQERAVGKDHPELAPYLVGLGAALAAQGDHASALATHRRAMDLLERSGGRDDPRLRPALLALAAAQGALGDATSAVRALERAVSLSPGKGTDQVAAEARFALARALLEGGLDQERALALASEARASYALAGNSREEERVARWIARRGPR